MALDAESGEILWKETQPSVLPITLAAAGGKLFMATTRGQVVRFAGE